MRTALKFLSSFTWQPVVRRKISKTQIFRHGNLTLVIPPGVFHPGYFFSTKILLRFLDTLTLRDKKLLELGCGSGLLALSAAQKGATVTASDINPTAVETLRKNAATNTIDIRVMHSDLFGAFGDEQFDVILVNPPFFPKNPVAEADYAWYCGAQYEYFQRLFSTGPPFLGKDGILYMILSEDCDHQRILGMAATQGWKNTIVYEKRNAWEKNTIYTFQTREKRE